MLPDLRIVIAAIVSTFVLSVGVGFYASSRLISEPKRGADSLVAFEETPVNRIALSWPALTQQSEALALDFAVTAKALRNPVRDVTNEPAAAAPQSPSVRKTATDLPYPPAERAVQTGLTQIDRLPAAVEPVPAPRTTEAPQPAPEPAIRVAVQYPPILELPPELHAPAVPTAPSAAAVLPLTDAPASTGSVAEPVADNPVPPATTLPDTRIASRPQPAEAATEDDPEMEEVPIPKPAPKAKSKTTAPKKAAPAKRPRPVRRAARPTIPNVTTFPWNFFGTTLPN
jgi:hypothetical protein